MLEAWAEKIDQQVWLTETFSSEAASKRYNRVFLGLAGMSWRK